MYSRLYFHIKFVVENQFNASENNFLQLKVTLTMGVCSSSENRPYDNLDLQNIKQQPTTKALFSYESGALLDDIHKMTAIPAVQFSKIIFTDKIMKKSKKSKLKQMSANIATIQTPKEYQTKQFILQMNDQFANKSLAKLCDVSRHFVNLCVHNIRIINLSEEIQRHFGCEDVRILHSTIQILHHIGFRFVSFNFLFF